jgi:uncharacterized protein
LFETCIWLNEPRNWAVAQGVLEMTTDKGSDFWRNTHNSFIRDSGHFFGSRWEAEFTASVCIEGDFADLYDQAGIMVRVDETAWVKAGIELSDGEPCLGSVLTVGQSDWATSVYHGTASPLYLRITVENGVLRIQWSQDGLRWPLLRLCPFPRQPLTLSAALPAAPREAA